MAGSTIPFKGFGDVETKSASGRSGSRVTWVGTGSAGFTGDRRRMTSSTGFFAATGASAAASSTRNVNIVSRTSPYSLYSESIATMEAGGSYNQDDASGFLRMMRLMLAVIWDRKYGGILDGSIFPM